MSKLFFFFLSFYCCFRYLLWVKLKSIIGCKQFILAAVMQRIPFARQLHAYLANSLFKFLYQNTLLPSSVVLTRTAFLPANLPWRMMTTLPYLRLKRKRFKQSVKSYPLKLGGVKIGILSLDSCIVTQIFLQFSHLRIFYGD